MAVSDTVTARDWVKILTQPSEDSHAVRLIDLNNAVAGVAPTWASLTGKPSFATVATTGAYADLTGKPTIPSVLPPTGAASGDLTGTYPAPTIKTGVVSIAKCETTLANTLTQMAPGWKAGESVTDGDLRWHQGDLYEANKTHVTQGTFSLDDFDPFPVAASAAWSEITGKPTFATVATSGSYSDLSGKPTALPPNGAAGGSLAGSYPNPSIANAAVDLAQLSVAIQNHLGALPPLWQSGEAVNAGEQRAYNELVYTANVTHTTGGTFEAGNWTATGGTNLPLDYTDNAQIANKPTLALVATSGDYDDLSNLPTLQTVATTGAYADLSGKPVPATVATSGSYSDLSGKPTLATVATTGDYGSLINKPSLATVATSGAYADLTGKPTALPPNGAAGGSLTGTYPNPTLAANAVTLASLATEVSTVLKAEAFVVPLTFIGNDPGHFIMPFDFTLTHYQLSCASAPSGGPTTVSIKDDDLVIASGSVPAGSTTTGKTALVASVAIAEGSEMDFEFVALPSGTGEGYSINLIGHRTI